MAFDRKELQRQLEVVFNESTLGDLPILNDELNGYELLERATLIKWVNQILRIKENGDEVEALKDLEKLEEEILESYRR